MVSILLAPVAASWLLRERIDKVKKWALSKKLVRLVVSSVYVVYKSDYMHIHHGQSACHSAWRLCEYHEQELEYWVNTRTSGTLSHEDLQKMSAMQSHEGEASGAPGDLADMNFDLGGFSEMTGQAPANLDVEGDENLQATKQNCLTVYELIQLFFQTKPFCH